MTTSIPLHICLRVLQRLQIFGNNLWEQLKTTILNFQKSPVKSGFVAVGTSSNFTTFRVISNQVNFSEVSGTCGNLKEVKTLVISRFFSSKKPQTPLYTTIFYIHINYIDFAHFWELIGNSLGKTFITYY